MLALAGRLDASSVRELWQAGQARGRRSSRSSDHRRRAGVDYCDGAGIALLVDLMRQRPKGDVTITHLKPAYAALVAQFDAAVLANEQDRPAAVLDRGDRRSPRPIGRDIHEQVAFVGEAIAALASAARHPLSVRWKDVWCDLRARRRRRAADRRADRVPDRRDPRVPVARSRCSSSAPRSSSPT